MKSFMLVTGHGPVVILTSYESVTARRLLDELHAKGIEKFLAFEIPIELAKARYGSHFFVVEHDLDESEKVRILDKDGPHAFRLFQFHELGPLIVYEPGTSTGSP